MRAQVNKSRNLQNHTRLKSMGLDSTSCHVDGSLEKLGYAKVCVHLDLPKSL